MSSTPIEIQAVFGTRPEATKMASVVNALQQDAVFDANVCVTAQLVRTAREVNDYKLH